MYIHTRTHTRLQFRQIIFYNFVTEIFCRDNLTARRSLKRGSDTGVRACITDMVFV